MKAISTAPPVGGAECRSCYGKLRGPSSRDSRVNCGCSDFVNPAPITEVFRFSVNGYETSIGSILRLNQVGAPSAVARLVIATCLNSVNRMVETWGCPHVLQKVLKTLCPSFAHCDSTASVVFSLETKGGPAACFHAHVNSVAVTNQWIGIAWAKLSGFFLPLLGMTSARPAVVSKNVRLGALRNCSALAFSQDVSALFAWGVTNDSPHVHSMRITASVIGGKI